MDDERKLAKNKHLQANELFVSQFSEMCRKYCVYKKIHPENLSQLFVRIMHKTDKRFRREKEWGSCWAA